MTMPVASTRKNPVTGQTQVWVEYDDGSGQGEWVDAVSTPDQSTTEIPQNFRVVFNTELPGFAELVDQGKNVGETWTNAAIRLATSIAMGAQQFKFMQLNVERARKGQPPIDAQEYSGAYVNVGLSAGTQQLVTYAGLALIGLVLLNMATKK